MSICQSICQFVALRRLRRSDYVVHSTWCLTTGFDRWGGPGGRMSYGRTVLRSYVLTYYPIVRSVGHATPYMGTLTNGQNSESRKCALLPVRALIGTPRQNVRSAGWQLPIGTVPHPRQSEVCVGTLLATLVLHDLRVMICSYVCREL